jgi:hypothetical protein
MTQLVFGYFGACEYKVAFKNIRKISMHIPGLCQVKVRTNPWQSLEQVKIFIMVLNYHFSANRQKPKISQYKQTPEYIALCTPN